MFMPRSVFNIQDDILDFTKLKQVTIERWFNLAEALGDLGSLLATEYGQLSLVTIFGVRKVNLTIADLQNFKFKIEIKLESLFF